MHNRCQTKTKHNTTQEQKENTHKSGRLTYAIDNRTLVSMHICIKF